MGSKTETLTKELLNVYLRGQTATSALVGSTRYVALYESSPTDDTVPTQIPAGRKSVTFDAPVELSGDDVGWGVYNAAAVEWLNWSFGPYLVSHYGIWTAATEGTLLYWGSLVEPVLVVNGNDFRFTAGSITVKET